MAQQGEEGRRRVLVLVGTRPEAIKMAPVVKGLVARSDVVELRLVLTGQHDQLVTQVLDAFRVVPSLSLMPQLDLGIMREGQDLYHVAEACLRGLKDAMRDFAPDMVLVQGDTASVFFGGLSAFFQRTALGHVEAGLRSGHGGLPYPDPYPEEIFRRLTDVLTTLHFAPTPWARQNLLREGVPEARIHVTGNTVVDALLATSRLRSMPKNADLGLALSTGRRLVLLTAHRRESFGAPLREAFAAVRELADLEEGVEVLYPVHPNPQVRSAASEVLQGHPRIRLTEPLDYLDLVLALRRAALVLTDSGGIQEEAPTFGTPVLVLRTATERPEGVEAGVARLVGTDGGRILEEARRALAGSRGQRESASAHGSAEAPLPNPYGDGRAGERIADIVAAHLTGRPRETTDWGGV